MRYRDIEADPGILREEDREFLLRAMSRRPIEYLGGVVTAAPHYKLDEVNCAHSMDPKLQVLSKRGAMVEVTDYQTGEPRTLFELMLWCWPVYLPQDDDSARSYDLFCIPALFIDHQETGWEGMPIRWNTNDDFNPQEFILGMRLKPINIVNVIPFPKKDK